VTTTPTWAASRDALPEGLSDEALELIRRATAPARHEARVIAAAEAALEATADSIVAAECAEASRERLALARTLARCIATDGSVRGGMTWCPAGMSVEAYLDSDDWASNARINPCDAALPDAVAWTRRAGVLCYIEAHGIGGPLGAGSELGGEATDRMSWARVLGKGRRHASDGGAWTDAIRRAGERLSLTTPSPEGVVALAVTCLTGRDLAWAQTYCRARIARLGMQRLQWGGATEAHDAELLRWSQALGELDELTPAPAETGESAGDVLAGDTDPWSGE